MSAIYYTKDHEYIRVDGNIGTVGITDYAQAQLGDVVYVELPSLGQTLEKGAEAAVVESVKAAGEVYAPVSGVVQSINDALPDQPSLVNEAPMAAGWFMTLTLTDPAQLDGLMDESAYKTYVEGLA